MDSNEGLKPRFNDLPLEVKQETNAVNTSGFTPKGNRVLVRPKVLEQMSKGGIAIPELARDKEQLAQMYGTVIEVGSEAWGEFANPWAKPGDTVLFGRYRGADVVGNDGVTYRIMNDVEIIATYSEAQ